MSFKEAFIEKYLVAREAALVNDQKAAYDALVVVTKFLANQYAKRNNDSIVIKAKLYSAAKAFDAYAKIVNQYGLADVRVQKLFGFIDDVASPSLQEIMSGDGNIPDPTKPAGTAEADGLDVGDLLPEIEIGMPVETTPAAPSAAKETPVNVPVDETPVVVSAEEPLAEIPAEEASIEETPAAEEPVAEEPVEETPAETVAAPAFNPNSLRDFIGQQKTVRALLREIAIAKAEGLHHLDNILLFGNPGLGKTTLMELIAKELGVRFELLDCSQFRNSQQSLKALQNFFMNIARSNEPVVIALDEVHMLTTELQSSLLTLLNNRVYVSPLDASGANKRIPIEEFTFIAATTDDDKVLDTIKNRCLRLTFQLVDYSHDELAQIYRCKVAAKGLTITNEAIEECIPRSRGAIRFVNAIVDGLDKSLYDDEGKRLSTHIDLATARKYFKEQGIGPLGLAEKDMEILRAIENDNDGTISADTLSAQVGLSVAKYLSEHERYLLKIGFISVSGRGRSLTEKAIKFLQEQKATARDDKPTDGDGDGEGDNA